MQEENTSSTLQYILLGFTVTIATLVLLFLMLSLSAPRFAGALMFAVTGSDRATLIASRGNSDVYVDLGSQYFGGAQPYNVLLAKEYFEKAISRDAENYLAHYQLARVLFVLNDIEGAKEHIDTSTALVPDFSRNYYMQGLIYGFAQEYEKAEAGFKEFITRQPNLWAGYVDLSWIYFAQGKFTEGRELLEPIVDMFPNNPWVANSYGLFLMHSHQFAEASEQFDIALAALGAMMPDDFGIAYPGNDPAYYEEGYEQMSTSIEHNIATLVQLTSQ